MRRRIAVIAVIALAAALLGGLRRRRGGAARGPADAAGELRAGRAGLGAAQAAGGAAAGAAVGGGRSALAGGKVGVVGVEGGIGVQPRSLEVSADGTLEGLEWATWTTTPPGGGAARCALRDCDPTCATGSLDELEATVRLSRPLPCGGARYFDRAVVRSTRTPPPETYVRAPC